MGMTIQSIPTEVLANIIIFVSTDSSRISELLDVLLAPNIQGKNQDSESVFRALCRLNDWNSHFPGRERDYSDTRLDHVEWKTFYAVLETWVPREGFYSVQEAHPWGLLVRLRFAREGIECDLLWPREENNDNKTTETSLFQIVPFFRVRQFQTNGSTSTVDFHSGVMSIDHVSITGIGWSAENSLGGRRLVLSKQTVEFPDRFSDHPNMGYGPSESLGGQLAYHLLWNPLNPSQPEDLLRSLFTNNANRMTLEMITGSSISSSNLEGLPLIHPGLYSGVYMNIYGKFKREIIKIELLRFDIGPREGNTDAWDDVQANLFNESDQEDDRGVFNSIKTAAIEARCETIAFIVGRKATGDYHVPMGKISFRALVYPDLGLERIFGAVPPTQVTDRGGNGRRQYSVVNSWFAWGTLAAPQFESPRWSLGRFVQVHERDSNQVAEQFGFVLDTDDSTATLLTRLCEQEEFPFTTHPGSD